MKMVRTQALLMGDGQPPAALWAAVWAEDWPTVWAEWEAWVTPALPAMHRTSEARRVALAVMVEATTDALTEITGAPVEFPEGHDDADAVNEWVPWIRTQVAAAHRRGRDDEWAAVRAGLPADLQGMAAQHPTEQAAAAATTFEIEMAMRDEGI